MDDQVGLVDVEEVLAVGVDRAQHAAVDELGARGEAALRRADRDLVAPEAADSASARGAGWCGPQASCGAARASTDVMCPVFSYSVEHVDAALVAAALELRGEERLDDGRRLVGGVHAGARPRPPGRRCAAGRARRSRRSRRARRGCPSPCSPRSARRCPNRRSRRRGCPGRRGPARRWRCSRAGSRRRRRTPSPRRPRPRGPPAARARQQVGLELEAGVVGADVDAHEAESRRPATHWARPDSRERRTGHGSRPGNIPVTRSF